MEEQELNVTANPASRQHPPHAARLESEPARMCSLALEGALTRNHPKPDELRSSLNVLHGKALGHAVFTSGTKASKAVEHAAKNAAGNMAGLGAGAVATFRGAAESLGKRVRRPKGVAADAVMADGASLDVLGDPDEA